MRNICPLLNKYGTCRDRKNVEFVFQENTKSPANPSACYMGTLGRLLCQPPSPLAITHLYCQIYGDAP